MTPVLCLIGGRTLFSQKSVAGVFLSDGKDLAHLVLDRPVVLDEEQVQVVARQADRKLVPAYVPAPYAPSSSRAGSTSRTCSR